MKSKQLAGVVFVAVVVVYAGSWLAMPYVPLLTNTRSAVDREAAEKMERARRLLQQYSFSLARAAAHSEKLDEYGVEFSDGESITEDAYQQIHEQLWADFAPMDWGEVPRAARASYANIPGSINSNVTASHELIQENEDWLEQAMAEVDSALSVSRGSISARDHAEAMRLKGAIAYQQGVAAWLLAKEARRQAAPLRNKLIVLSNEAGVQRFALDRVEESGIESQIDKLTETRARDTEQLKETAARLEEIDGKIAEIDGKLAAARARADAAEQAMNRLQLSGADLTRKDGAMSFAADYLGYDAEYRKANREIQSLTVGALPYASVDRTEDFLKGAYLENGSSKNLTVEPGLEHYEADRAVVSREYELQRRSLDELEQDILRLEGMKVSLQSDQDGARKALSSLAPTTEEAVADLDAAESRAAELEDRALALFDEAARLAQQAAGNMKRRIQESGRRVQRVAAEAQSRSAFDVPSKSNWMSGHITAQVADAHLARAWVLYDRFGTHRQNAELLQSIADSLQIDAELVEEQQVSADEAQEAAIEEVKSAMNLLESAHRDTARHWTLVAQAGGAVYLLSLLGDDSYAADAAESYRLAIQGREDERAAEIYAQRIAQIESR